MEQMGSRGLRSLAYLLSLLAWSLISLLCSAAVSGSTTQGQAVVQRKPARQLTGAEQIAAQKAKLSARPMVQLPTGELVQPVGDAELQSMQRMEQENAQDISDADLDTPTAMSTDDTTALDTPTDLKTILLNAAASAVQKGQELVVENKISLKLPVLGTASVQLEPDPFGKQVRLKVAFTTKSGNNLFKIRPVVLNDMTLTSLEGKLTGRLHSGDTVNVFGAPATFRIKKLVLGEYGTLINKVIFDVEFAKPFAQVIPGINAKIEFSRAYLTLSDIADYPVTLTARVTFLGKPMRLIFLYSPSNKVSLALQVKNVPLKSVVRATAGTPLRDMQVTRGRLLVDLWVPSPQYTADEIHIPEEDPARQLRIEGDVEKMPIVLDEVMGDGDTGEAAAELATACTQDLHGAEGTAVPFTHADTPPEIMVQVLPAQAQAGPAALAANPQDVIPPRSAADVAAIAALPDTPDGTEATPEASLPEFAEADFTVAEPADLTTVDTPDELKNPDLVHPGDTELDPALVQDALPTPDYLDEADAGMPVEACDVQDICCREPGTELLPHFSLQAMLSRVSTYLAMSGNDIKLPRIGVVQNVSIMLNIDGDAQRRDDVELRPDLAKKSLQKTRAELLLQISCLPIGSIGFVEDGVISMVLQKREHEDTRNTDVVYAVKSGKLTLVGTMRLKIPKLGKLPIAVNAALTKKGIMFSGALDFCESWKASEVTQTGFVKDKSCKKNSLQYKGMTLENVRVTYGNPPLNAAEQMAANSIATQRSDLRQQAKDKLAAAREIRDAQLRGETPSATAIESAQKPVPSVDSIQKYKRDKALSLIATANMWGIRFVVTLTVIPAVKAEDRDLIFAAKGVVKNFKPFKYIPGMKDVKALRDIAMSEVTAEIQWAMNKKRQKPMPSLKLAGAMALFGATLRASFKWVVSKQGVPGLFIYTPPQRQQSLADLIPPLASVGMFREITCCDSSIAISTVSEIDTSYFTADEMVELAPYRLDTIRKGVSLVGNVPLTGPLDPIGKFLGIASPTRNACQAAQSQFRLLANINMDKPPLSEFRIAITKSKLRQLSSTSVHRTPAKAADKTLYSNVDTRFTNPALNPFNKKPKDYDTYGAGLALALPNPTPPAPRREPLVELDTVEIFILGDMIRPSFGVAAIVLVRPTQNIGDLLRLKGSFEFGPTTVTLGAQMLGTWHNAFTLSGWNLSDVAIVLGFLYGATMPVRLGGAARLDVKKDFSADFKFMADADVSDMGFEVNVSRVITLLDLVAFTLGALKVTLPGDMAQLPMPLELYNTGMRYAPTDIRIGDQTLEAGFGVHTEFKLLGKHGKVDMHVNGAGLKALGTVEQINVLNVLKVTGAGGTGDPKVDIEASLGRQNFLISGTIAIADLVKAEAYMQLSSAGFSFNFSAIVGKSLFEGKPLLDAQVTGRTSGPITNPQFTVIFDFQQYFQEFIKKEADEGLKIAEKAVEDGINHAQSQINKIDGVIRNADAKIKAAEAEVNHARSAIATIKKVRDTATQKIAEAQSRVNSIKKEIQELDRWYNGLPAA